MPEQEVRTQFERWLEDGETWIGVFQNNPMARPSAGVQRVAMPFDDSQDAELGSRAPDTRKFIGWSYQLVSKCRTVDEAMEAMFKEGSDD